MSSFDEIQSALRERADLNARLSLIPYEGTPEIKEVSGQKYLYTRKRIGSKITSTYVGPYLDELYQLLLRNTREAREIRKSLRKLDKTLAQLGYQEAELPPRVIQNLDFARANMKANIYDQAVLEGVATSFPQTEEIIENGKVNGMTASDVQKILEYVKSFGYINDRRYVDLYLISHGDRYSIREMQQKLRSRGISKDFFYEVLESSDYEGEEPALKKILAKRLKGRSVEELTYEEKQKHMAYFARKGYSFEKIREIFSFS